MSENGSPIVHVSEWVCVCVCVCVRARARAINVGEQKEAVLTYGKWNVLM